MSSVDNSVSLVGKVVGSNPTDDYDYEDHWVLWDTTIATLEEIRRCMLFVADRPVGTVLDYPCARVMVTDSWDELFSRTWVAVPANNPWGRAEMEFYATTVDSLVKTTTGMQYTDDNTSNPTRVVEARCEIGFSSFRVVANRNYCDYHSATMSKTVLDGLINVKKSKTKEEIKNRVVVIEHDHD